MNSLNNELGILVQTGSGLESDLLKKMPLEAIQELELVGYIVRGVTPEGQKVWSASKEAKKDYEIYYSTPSFCEKALGLFMYYTGLRVHL